MRLNGKEGAVNQCKLAVRLIWALTNLDGLHLSPARLSTCYRPKTNLGFGRRLIWIFGTIASKSLFDISTFWVGFNSFKVQFGSEYHQKVISNFFYQNIQNI